MRCGCTWRWSSFRTTRENVGPSIKPGGTDNSSLHDADVKFLKVQRTCSDNNQIDLLHDDCLDERSSGAEEKQQRRGKGRKDLCTPTENDMQKCDSLPWTPYILWADCSGCYRLKLWQRCDLLASSDRRTTGNGFETAIVGYQRRLSQSQCKVTLKKRDER